MNREYYRSLIYAAVVILASVFSLDAQVTIQRDSTAVAILTEALTPTKAAATLIQDSVSEGEIQFSNGEKGSIRVTTQGSRRLRYELVLPKQQITSVIKDGFGYYVLGNQKKNFPVWITAYQSLDHLPVLSRIAEYLNPNVKIVDVGVVTFAGRQCEDIRISIVPVELSAARVEDLMSELHVFVDAKSKEIAGTRGFIFSPEAIENRSPVDRVFSDYRLLNGVPTPMRIEEYTDGRPDHVIVWSSIKVNTGVLPTLFD